MSGFTRLRAAALTAGLGLLVASCSGQAGVGADQLSVANAEPAAATTSSPADQSGTPLVLVTYYTETGMTGRMAEQVAEGARSVAGVRVVLAPIDSVQPADLLAADGIVLGSPTHWANIATPMRSFLDSWPSLGVAPRDRIGGAFATGGGNSGGKEMVVNSLILAMLNHGMIIVGPIFREGDVEYGNFGVAAATGPMSNQTLAAIDLDAALALGRRVAEVVIAFRQ